MEGPSQLGVSIEMDASLCFAGDATVPFGAMPVGLDTQSDTVPMTAVRLCSDTQSNTPPIDAVPQCDTVPMANVSFCSDAQSSKLVMDAETQLDTLPMPSALMSSNTQTVPMEACPFVVDTQSETVPMEADSQDNAVQSVPSGASPGILGAFDLSLSKFQDLTHERLVPCEDKGHRERLETAVLEKPVIFAQDLGMAVPLLVGSLPVLESGQRIFAQLPSQWLDFTGKSGALGTRSLFTSRRHEHSVFAAVPPERQLRVPAAASQWQPQFVVPPEAVNSAVSGEMEPWVVEVHPGTHSIRVLVQPGSLMLRMLRRGTALPSARFSWRIVDTSHELEQPGAKQQRPVNAAKVGEFSVLSNLEDAASTQPPQFIEHPLRREQLRSLGWMVSQERSRHDPFITELRESVSCPDAPHWRLEGRLLCEYADVNGGVLADAIGYGKTACTIGLINFDQVRLPPQIPEPYKGFIPSRATLVLVPTNLHTQWIAEITKFTGNALKVISVPTCSQLKRLTTRELMEADVVVATYRLFYSSAYLARLAAIACKSRPQFKFPRFPGTGGSGCAAGTRRANAEKVTAQWARAYREAFELLPAWASKLAGLDEGSPATPDRQSGRQCADITPAAVDQPRGKKFVPDSQPDSPAKRRRLCGKQASQQVSSESDVQPDWADCAHYAPLEAFWWKRVVCDEFHELLGRYPPAQVAVELFHADYKWGLSGTPPCQTLGHIRKAAGFLGVQLPIGAGTDESGDAPRKVGQEWLDAYMRRNTIELPPLEEEERIIPVQQTPKERALYLALTEHQACQPVLEGFEEPSELQDARQSASGMLKLCSHFCPSGASDVLTAEDECARQLALRREQVCGVQREVRGFADRAISTLDAIRHFEPNFCQTVAKDKCSFLAKESKPRVASRLKFLGASATGSKADLIERLFVTLQTVGVSEDAKELALRVDFNAATAGLAADLPAVPSATWLALQELMSKSSLTAEHAQQFITNVLGEAVAKAAQERPANVAPARCTRLRFNMGMPQWPGEATKDGAAQKRLEEECWTWLTDEVQAGSVRKVVSAWKQELERFSSRIVALEADMESKMRSLRSFQESLNASQVSEVEVIAEPELPQFAKFGSKIQALVQHVQKLQSNDPQSKIICFVQWEDLNHKLSLALEEFGVKHLTLRGSVWARRSVLTRFQFEDDSPRLLLLSLQESASGTNLTAANHVIIMHPMEAATREEAVAFEMQAVGRVRRPGQQRKIHIWRFVTVGTIEQKITEEHQKELWERQRVSLPTLQPSAVDDGESCDEEEAAGVPDLDQPMFLADQGVSQQVQEDSATQVYHNVSLDDSATQVYVDMGQSDEGRGQVAANATQCYMSPCVVGN